MSEIASTDSQRMIMKCTNLCLWGFLCLCVLKVLNWAPAGLFGAVQSGVCDMDTNWHQRHDTATIQSHGLLIFLSFSLSLCLSVCLTKSKHIIHTYSRTQWRLNTPNLLYNVVSNWCTVYQGTLQLIIPLYSYTFLFYHNTQSCAIFSCCITVLPLPPPHYPTVMKSFISSLTGCWFLVIGSQLATPENIGLAESEKITTFVWLIIRAAYIWFCEATIL